MKLKAILIEDEANSREILRNYLAKYCADVNLLGEATSIEEGLKLIGNNEPNLVFLDVEIPFGNAFDLLEQCLNALLRRFSGLERGRYSVLSGGR